MRTRDAVFSALWAVPLAIAAQEVIPDFYKDPGIYPNRDYVNQGFGEHVDPFTGSLQLHYVDMHLPGNGKFDLKIIRSYNSASVEPTNPATHESLAGVGWNIHFGRVLKSRETTLCGNKNAQSVADNPVLELPDGSRQLLAFTGSTSPLMLTTQRWRADCITSGAGGLLVTSPGGTQYQMTQLVNVGSGVNPVYAWFTTRITDRNGNSATIAYAAEASPQISGVTTSDGRSVGFSYADSGLASRRITAISSAGQTFSYGYQAISGYTGKYHLTAVTRPGGTAWNYEYNGNLNSAPGSHVVRRVLHPEGGSIAYTYGFVYFDNQANPASRSTVVTGKTRSTGGTWSFSYAPGAPGSYDTTTVNAPDGTTVYRHIGPNYSSSGTVWMVGLLASKAIGGLQTETYTWGKQKISSENNFRPGAFVLKVDAGEVNAPLLTQKTIVRDGASHTTSYSGFDGYGNPGMVTESGPQSGNRTSQLTYYVNPSKWILHQLQNDNRSGAQVSRTFDANGNMTSITQDGVTTQHAYDSQGNIVSTTFPRGITHTYGAYKRGIAQAEQQPEGISISRTVSDAGNVTSETNGGGQTFGYAYDGLNRLISVAYPAGNPVTLSYGAASRIVGRGMLSETTQYDGFGNTISVNTGGIVRSFAVDALGRKVFESNPGTSAGTAYQYDVLGRPVRIANADGTARMISYGAGTQTVTDERGKATTHVYRAYGDPDRRFLMAVSTAEPATNLTIARNSRDLVTDIVQAGVMRSYGYNGNYYLSSATHPESGTTSYGRDAAGNMTSRSAGTLGTIAYTYDGQNRLRSITYPGSTGNVAHAYDGAHRLMNTSSPDASRSFAYDGNGNIVQESLNTAGISWSARYGYDGNDRLTSITYPRSGSTVTYGLDGLGRPTSVSGYVNSVAYWPSGQIQRIAYANGVQSDYGQHPRLWASSFATSRSGSYFHQSAYTYDGVGNLMGISDPVDPQYTRMLGYDGVNRLTTLSTPNGSGTIAYSGSGNITSQRVGSEQLNYQYDGSNRLTALNAVPGELSTTYAYDATGNIVAGAGRTFQYDAVPNLRCIDCGNPDARVQFEYDGDQKRTTILRGSTKTHEFHGVHGNLLADYTPGTPGKLTEYIYLHGKRIAQKESTQ
ncbi:DUF6531 domain-containing protein [Acidovorax sp. NCPPB 2350]|nr:DUF6531 domain-containing protein [Acidovorax sp. NCPPB 2350]